MINFLLRLSLESPQSSINMPRDVLMIGGEEERT